MSKILKKQKVDGYKTIEGCSLKLIKKLVLAHLESFQHICM